MATIRDSRHVNSRSKLIQQKKAANYIAGLMLDSLQQFPKEEQERRLQEIHKNLKSRPSKPGKHSKRSPKRASLPLSRRSAARR